MSNDPYGPYEERARAYETLRAKLEEARANARAYKDAWMQARQAQMATELRAAKVREELERAEKENKLNQEIFKAIRGVFGYGDEPIDLVTYIAEDVGRMRAVVEAACRWGASSRDNRLLDAMRLEDALSAYRAESCPAKEDEP